MEAGGRAPHLPVLFRAGEGTEQARSAGKEGSGSVQEGGPRQAPLSSVAKLPSTLITPAHLLQAPVPELAASPYPRGHWPSTHFFLIGHDSLCSSSGWAWWHHLSQLGLCLNTLLLLRATRASSAPTRASSAAAQAESANSATARLDERA